MRIHMVARKMKLTKPIKDFIGGKIEKMREYADNIVWTQAIVSVEKKTHNAEVIMHVGHQTIKASAASDDLYSAIDKVMDKIEIQLKKYKGKTKNHRAYRPHDFSDFSAIVGPKIKISVVKDVSSKPMNIEEAVFEMEKTGYNFWFFMDKPSKQMQVVFKRLDDSYGILQPLKK
ncbi:MAG: ribosome-associated translation inhibitor RaiA [Elusimicrobia bacterium]|nr:ribosome-associated translation inhibitor RaiA [Elusimicrobiota bacterium]